MRIQLRKFIQILTHDDRHEKHSCQNYADKQTDTGFPASGADGKRHTEQQKSDGRKRKGNAFVQLDLHFQSRDIILLEPSDFTEQIGEFHILGTNAHFFSIGFFAVVEVESQLVGKDPVDRFRACGSSGTPVAGHTFPQNDGQDLGRIIGGDGAAFGGDGLLNGVVFQTGPAEQDAFEMEVYRGVQYDNDTNDTTNAICDAACTTARDVGATAVIAVTMSGYTARRMSKFRPSQLIIAATPNEKTFHQLSLSWGVYPVVALYQPDANVLFDHAIACAKQNDLVVRGDKAVITAGVPLGIEGTTNLLKVQIVQ